MTMDPSEVEEIEALRDADSLHLLPPEALIASIKYLAEKLLAAERPLEMKWSIERPFAHLLLGVEELDELVLATDARCHSIGNVMPVAATPAMKRVLAEKWGLNNSLRTAITEARYSLDPLLRRRAEETGSETSR